MDQRHEDAIRSFMAIMPTMEAFIPAMVDACNLGARREEVIEAVSSGRLIPMFEAKYRQALVELSTEELEAITALFAAQPSSLRTVLLKWASGMAWAATEVKGYINGEYDRLLGEDLK